jgi:hypothetical protein
VYPSDAAYAEHGNQATVCGHHLNAQAARHCQTRVHWSVGRLPLPAATAVLVILCSRSDEAYPVQGKSCGDAVANLSLSLLMLLNIEQDADA